MSESKIPVGTTGKDLRTFEQTTTAGTVHTEAVSIVDPDNVDEKAAVVDDRLQVNDPTTQSKLDSVTAAIESIVNANLEGATNSLYGTINDGENFTGEWVEILQYHQVNVAVNSDQALTMEFEFSADGVTAIPNIVPSFEHVGNSKGRRFQFGIYARYFRVKLSNNSGSQATVTAQTLLFKESSHLTIHRLGNDISDDTSVEVVKSIVSGKAPSGDYVPLPVGGIHPGSFSQANLADGESFAGEYQDTRGMNSALAFVFSDVQLSDVQVRWSQDGVSPRPGLIGASALAEVEIGTFYVYISTLTTMVDNYTRLEYTNNSGGPTSLLESDVWFYEDAFAGSYGSLTADLSAISTALLTRSVLAGVKPDGSFDNVAIDFANRLKVAAKSKSTQSGSQFVESIRDDISLEFTASRGQDAVSAFLDEGNVNGSASHDTVEGQAVFQTTAAPGSVVYLGSPTRTVYEAGHSIRGEQTIEIDSLSNIVGDAEVRWGFALSDSGDIENGMGWGVDATGTFIWRRKNGVDESKVYQSSFDRDTLSGQQNTSFYTKNGPQALDVTQNNLYSLEFEWLGIAPPEWSIMAPYGEIIPAHTEETPNNQKGTTVPDPEMRMFVRIQNDTTAGGNIEVRSGSWRGGIYTAKQPISAPDSEGVLADIGRINDAQKNHIASVDENAEIGTRVNEINAEIKVSAPTMGQNFRRVLSSDSVTPLPLPTNLSRVKGFSIRHAGTLGIDPEVDSEETVFWSWSALSVATNGFPLYSTDPQDFHYGEEEGADPSTINPIYFTCSGTSTEVTQDIEGDTVDSSSGVTSPSNMFASDDSRATFTSNTSTATLSGFDFSGITGTITTVKLKCELRKEPGAAGEQASVGSAGAVDATSSTTITTPTITFDPDALLVVFFARRAVDADITNVTNTMGYTGYEVIGDVNNGNESHLTVVYMTGTPTQNGTVSGIVDAGTDHEVAGYVYLENVKTTGIVTDTVSNATQGSFTDTVAGTENGVVVQAIASEIAAVTTVAGNFTEQAEDGSTTNNDQSLNIATDLVETTGSITWGANLTETGDVAAIAISFLPADALDPQFEISHSEGSTTLTGSATSESDAEFEIDVTGDTEWSASSTPTITVSSPLVGNADLEIDQAWLEVATSTGSVDLRIAWIGYE